MHHNLEKGELKIIRKWTTNSDAYIYYIAILYLIDIIYTYLNHLKKYMMDPFFVITCMMDISKISCAYRWFL